MNRFTSSLFKKNIFPKVLYTAVAKYCVNIKNDCDSIIKTNNNFQRFSSLINNNSNKNNLSFSLHNQYRFNSNSSLHQNAIEELNEEKNNANKPVVPPVPSGWSIEHLPGQQVFTLTRSHSEDELITLNCSFSCRSSGNKEAGEGENSEHEHDDGVYSSGGLELIILKKSTGDALVCALAIAQDELVIDGVAHVPGYDKLVASTTSSSTSSSSDIKNVNRSDELAKIYPGPVMAELSEPLVNSIVDFLEKRGLNDDLAVFIDRYAEAKEQEEYEGWLARIAEFAK